MSDFYVKRYYETVPIDHGRREGRASQRYRVQAFRRSRPTMMITSEKATQKSMTSPRLSVHHTSFLWALCHELVRSMTHRFVAALSGAGLPFSEISASSPRSCRRLRVIPES